MKTLKFLLKALLIIIVLLAVNYVVYTPPEFAPDTSLVAPGPAAKAYAEKVLSPELEKLGQASELDKLIRIANIMCDPVTGVGRDSIEINTHVYHYALEKVHLGWLFRLTRPEKERITLTLWYWNYMKQGVSGIFFAPSGEEIIRSRAAFGCSHHARAFLAAVSALGLPQNPADLRYAVTCKADDYNKARETNDLDMTINGHQFVIYRSDQGWKAINTSKGTCIDLSPDFTPESVKPPHNIPVVFPSYPDVTFLFRAISPDSSSGCEDNSLQALMNIYRSGDPENPEFKWDIFN